MINPVKPICQGQCIKTFELFIRFLYNKHYLMQCHIPLVNPLVEVKTVGFKKLESVSNSFKSLVVFSNCLQHDSVYNWFLQNITDYLLTANDFDGQRVNENIFYCGQIRSSASRK